MGLVARTKNMVFFSFFTCTLGGQNEANFDFIVYKAWKPEVSPFMIWESPC